MGRDRVRRDTRPPPPLDEATSAWLLAALRTDAAAPPGGKGVDWATLASRARSDGLAPLLHRRLAGEPHDAPETFIASLRGAYYQSVSANNLRLAELHRIGRRLADQGIPLLVLKGGALAVDVYDHPGLRFMGDLDVAVPPDQTQAALAVFAAAGYRQHDGRRPGEADVYNEGWHIRLVAEVHGRSLEVELHWPNRRRVLVSQQAELDVEALWRTAVPLADLPNILQPSPTYMLLHLCLHLGLQHRFTDLGLRAVVDIDRLVRHAGDALWPDLPSLARAARARHTIYYALDVTSRLLGTPVMAATLAEMAPDAARQAQFAAVLPPPAIINRERIFYGSRRPLWRRLTADHRWDMALGFWRELFPGPRYLATYYRRRSNSGVAAFIFWHPFHTLLRAGRRRWRERLVLRRSS